MLKTNLILKYGLLCLLLIFRLAGPSDRAIADEMKKPVFYLKYLYGQGFTEDQSTDEDNTDLAAATDRHTVSLRIKEEFNKLLTTNLLFYFTRQKYLLENGSYYYFYFLPDFTYALTDQLDLYTGFKIKWKYFDELDSAGYAKDFINLAFKTKLLFKPLQRLTIAPFLNSNFNLNENNLATTQYYDFGLTITSKWDYVTLSGRYKGQASFPLGAESLINTRLANEFGINLTWDPN